MPPWKADTEICASYGLACIALVGFLASGVRDPNPAHATLPYRDVNGRLSPSAHHGTLMNVVTTLIRLGKAHFRHTTQSWRIHHVIFRRHRGKPYAPPLL